jgi:hypothetical protein
MRLHGNRKRKFEEISGLESIDEEGSKYSESEKRLKQNSNGDYEIRRS